MLKFGVEFFFLEWISRDIIKIEIMVLLISDSLGNLIQQISQEQCYLEAIRVAKEKYNICGTNIDFLSPDKVL
jgi:hypothetical protein